MTHEIVKKGIHVKTTGVIAGIPWIIETIADYLTNESSIIADHVRRWKRAESYLHDHPPSA